MKTYPIQSELDFLLARAQGERTEMETLLTQAREEDDYWREKVAAKLAAFLDLEAEFLSRLAELREEYPELATALDERKRYLRALIHEAHVMHEHWQRSISAE